MQAIATIGPVETHESQSVSANETTSIREEHT
jgi:hypothetical protein